MSDRTCSVDGCGNKVVAWGLCDMHYRRWKKDGDPGTAEKRALPGRICAVSDCGRPSRAHGWCKAHYQRWVKYGDPLADHRIIRKPCSIEGCDRLARARGWCELHWDRFRRHGDPLHVDEVGFPSGSAHPDWVGDRVGYAGMHDRLARTLGPARAHSCRDCGGPAAEWSYEGGDPRETTDPRRPDAGPYSTDPAFYAPRCVSCHRLFDNARKRETVSPAAL